MGSCLIIPSDEGKTVVASVITELMKPHKINPTERNGRNSFAGALKIFPKIIPMQAIDTPIETVIQKGPRLDLLYLCLISEYARKTGNLMFLKDETTSWEPSPYKLNFIFRSI